MFIAITKLVAILLTISGVIGFFSSFHDLETFIVWLKTPWDKKRKFLKSVEHLRQATDYFNAHIVQIGGEYSKLYSLSVSCNKEGGWYLHPPDEFVGIFFTRAGLMGVIPTELTHSAGFVIDSMSQDGENWVVSKLQIFVTHQFPI